MIIYVPVSLFASWFTEKYGLRKALVTGSVISFVGTFMRMIIYKSLVCVIIGQSLIAVGYPFILNMPAKLSA